MALNRHLPPVNTGQFAMVPRADVPRSTFKTSHAHKTTLQGNALVPLYVDEVLPGDVFKGNATLFVRMATPLFPIMDDIEVETFFFFVPNRLSWANWVKLMGEQTDPGDSISYLVPHLVSPAGGWEVGQLGDYFGLPVKGASSGVGCLDFASTVKVNALPFRAYNRIWNEWFRPQDFADSLYCPTDDGPDNVNNYGVQRRYKKHDYFTSALPWPTKNNDLPNILVGGAAPVYGIGGIGSTGGDWTNVPTGAVGTGRQPIGSGDTLTSISITTVLDSADGKYEPYIWADLSSATGATVNSLRLSVATQQLLERDARGGTRYTEILRSHFGVTPQDSRLQRPEYIGGGRMKLNTQAIPQTAPAVTEGDGTVGALGAATTGAGRHEFSLVAQEHGFIIGLVNITGEVTYQQGIHRMWTRETRYDFYWPSFAFLGEQAIRNDEIYAKGSADPTYDKAVWGYQERWAEYRYKQSKVTGQFRSAVTGTMDSWHLAQFFTTAPTLSSGFIAQDTPFARVLAAGELAATQQFLLDSAFQITCTRALPVRSVPGLTRF